MAQVSVRLSRPYQPLIKVWLQEKVQRD